MPPPNHIPTGFHVNFKSCETIKCENCDSIYFTTVTVMKKISKLLSGQDNTVSFLNLWKCVNCGRISHITNPIPEETIQKNDKS